jgi:hypothetical protein
MGVEFSDAQVASVTINVTDDRGRKASLTFEDKGVHFYNRRPRQGKASFVSYAQLLNLAKEQNAEFFDRPKRRSGPHLKR